MRREWGGNEKGEVSLRATWDQGGRDRTTQQEGFQVSKRDSKEEGVSKGNWQGELARGLDRGLRHDSVLLICVCVS